MSAKTNVNLTLRDLLAMAYVAGRSPLGDPEPKAAYAFAEAMLDERAARGEHARDSDLECSLERVVDAVYAVSTSIDERSE